MSIAVFAEAFWEAKRARTDDDDDDEPQGCHFHPSSVALYKQY